MKEDKFYLGISVYFLSGIIPIFLGIVLYGTLGAFGYKLYLLNSKNIMIFFSFFVLVALWLSKLDKDYRFISFLIPQIMGSIIFIGIGQKATTDQESLFIVLLLIIGSIVCLGLFFLEEHLEKFNKLKTLPA